MIYSFVNYSLYLRFIFFFNLLHRKLGLARTESFHSLQPHGLFYETICITKGYIITNGGDRRHVKIRDFMNIAAFDTHVMKTI